MAQPPRNLPHLRIEGSGETERYTYPGGGNTPSPPRRDREQHAAALSAAIGAALQSARDELAAREPTIAEGVPGFYLQVSLPQGESEAVDKLENRQKHIEVVSVKKREGTAFLEATVFVPVEAQTFYADKVTAYRSQETPAGNPRNEALVARMETVSLASIHSLFTDDTALFPPTGKTVWWEVWLRQGTRERFIQVADRLDIPRREHVITFRERDVMLALADEAAMTRVIRNCDAVAELRLAKDTPALFLNMDGAKQREWSDDVLARVTSPAGATTAVCLLDSGVTQGHPLIRNILDQTDMHTVQPAWGVADTASQWGGHGTAMSGVAIYGDLHALFAGTQAITLRHRLESVKILPPNGQNDPDLYGAITTEAVARSETQAPHRQRVICMAVTSANPVPGRPSSWSSAIDQLCFDEDSRRLVVLSAGNIDPSVLNPAEYPDRNDVHPVEDPAQAWNALTVGAFTNKVNITDPAYIGWQPVGLAGDISPCSRTSVTWDRQWPIKPDVVFEGGNYATDGIQSPQSIDDLRLLTTHWRPNMRLLDTIGDTSGAAALGANLAAQIMAARPGLWPETVRGLIVHSASWTPAMRARMKGASKTERHALLRRYGYGVPDLDRAILSASNDLTLLIEDVLHPFDKQKGSDVKAKDMRLHKLPWPKKELIALGETRVQFRITLSYFVEPNPGERGWTRRHRYASHNLRFAVKRATETVDEFRRRINKAARDEEEGNPPTSSDGEDNWLLGRIRDRGSLHSDWWSGTAIDLAERDAVGIFPVGGWWKEKPYLDRWDTEARYSLIVTIRAPEAVVDLYTPVANQISIPIMVAT